MSMENLIASSVGIVVLVLGLCSFINPNLTRFIKIPIGDNLKAILATIVGAIIILVSFIL